MKLSWLRLLDCQGSQFHSGDFTENLLKSISLLFGVCRVSLDFFNIFF